MGVIDLSAYKPVPATLGDANQVANGFQAIQNLVNGSIDNLNFAAGRIFDPAKLMQNAAIDGDPLVWDNTLVKWVPASTLAAGRPRAPRVIVSTLAGGPPASPVDQDIWIATAVDGAGCRWAFQYNAGGASFKWEFIGGGQMTNVIYTSEGTASFNSWVDLATVGPSITLVRAGDYRIAAGITVSNFGGAAASAYFSLFMNNVTQLSPSGTFTTSTSGQGMTGSAEDTITGLGAAAALKLKYQGSVGTNFTWANRWIRVTPVRIA